jgi:hypothetical protein
MIIVLDLNSLEIGLIWLRKEPVAGSCEQDNEPSGSIIHQEILE